MFSLLGELNVTGLDLKVNSDLGHRKSTKLYILDGLSDSSSHLHRIDQPEDRQFAFFKIPLAIYSHRCAVLSNLKTKKDCKTESMMNQVTYGHIMFWLVVVFI